MTGGKAGEVGMIETETKTLGIIGGITPHSTVDVYS
jgi:hypothetical protein